MATREQKIRFALKRFKGFWNQFRRSKRGIVGLAVILLFSLVAIFAPLIAPYRPIEPQFSVGKYPRYGPVDGINIADQLCKPYWYKYLPWIPKGETELTELFYSFFLKKGTLIFVPDTGFVPVPGNVQLFIPDLKYSPILTVEQKIKVADDRLRLTHRVARIDKIEATFLNGTTLELSYPTEWEPQPRRPREISLTNLYPDETKFKVLYKTGVDLVENMKIVNDHTFTLNQSFSQEWNWTTNSTYPALVSVVDNSQKGFSFRPAETVDRGCIEISYDPGEVSPSQPIEVTVSRSFTYPYYEPPKSFFIHTSIMVNGLSQVKMNILFFRENESAPFLVATKPTNPSTQYSHHAFLSSDPAIAENLKSTPPQDKIFVAPGNYKFAVQIVIPPGAANMKVYLDNLDSIIYGNVFGLLGTDNHIPYPQDIFSLLVYGSRVSLFVGVVTAIFSTVIGLFLGLVSGYVGGMVDEGIMRFADLLLVLPTLPLFIVLVVSLRTVSGYVSMWNIIIILTLLGWMSFARSVRSMVLSIRERAFIEAAKAAGAGKLHIINRHIIPNVFALVYVTLATAVPGAIVVEASLSWLGLGDPRLASWGKVLYDFNVSGISMSKGLLEYWFWIFPACIAIALLATAFILVGYALDEILNPRLRERR